MNAATLKDVAKQAGVSIATVSLVLNGKGSISQEVREKVYEAARKLDYIRPNYSASLAAKHISHVALLVYEDYEKAFEWNFIREMIINLEAVMTRNQYYLLIIPVSSRQATNDILEKILLSKTGALLSIHYGNAELFSQLEKQGIPVVLVNNSQFQNQFHTVCVDDFQGAYEGAKYLLKLGHTRLAYVEYRRPDIPAVVNDRFVGFKKALDEAHLDFSEHERITVDLYKMGKLQHGICQLFENVHPPTAIFAHDDYLAAQTIVALQNIKLRVPEDVSIIAPGDTLDYSQVFIPRITTMKINTSLLGTLAGEMVLRRLKSPRESLNVLKVNQQLIERGSCKRVKASSIALREVM